MLPYILMLLKYFIIHLTSSLNFLFVWQPDSLGPFDLEIPSNKYHSDDPILSDSGLNRLIANSLDAFQNCSFFGIDKKETPSTVEAQKTATLSDFKIGSGI
jgi:hypothetical protein